MADLTKLNKLTAELEDFILGSNNNYTEYKPTKGTVIGFGLYHNDNMAAMRTFCAKGTVFPTHQHKEREWVIVYEGELKFTVKDETKTLKRGDFIYIPQDTGHSFNVIEDTWVLCVTIPASPDYPGAKR